MNEMNNEILQQKLDITAAAVQLYVEHDGHFTVHQVAEKTDREVAEVFEYFSDKKAILHFFYTSLIIRYRFMIDEIDDFDSYTLSEKLFNFVYASFDMIAEHQSFVDTTFKELILHSFATTEYEKRIQALLSDFFRNDSLITASSSFVLNDCSYHIMRRKYLWLVTFWLDDESENKEVTMELTDKLTGLLQEIMYTSAIDRGIDLLKFLYSNKILSKRIPFYKKITSTFDIR